MSLRWILTKRLYTNTPFRGPQPIPLGNRKDQEEFTKLLKKESTDKPLEYQYPDFPDNTNPQTGEIGGPKGTEPTRYGDWERKGRVSDF